MDCEIQALAFHLVFRDEGLPFDPGLIKGSASTDASGDPSPGSLGLTLIRHAVDEAQWVNCGRQGIE